MTRLSTSATLSKRDGFETERRAWTLISGGQSFWISEDESALG
jgi:hypothetical protein